MTPRLKPAAWLPLLRALCCLIALAVYGTAGAQVTEPNVSERVFHRALWSGTALKPFDWDTAADAGYTLVHSDSADPLLLRAMMDEAHGRGLKMIGGSGQTRQAPWLRLNVDRTASDAPQTLRCEVRHHYSDDHASLVLLASPGHPLHMKVIPLGGTNLATIGELASHLNSLGYGLSARVGEGKEHMRADFLGAWQYGDFAQTEVALIGNELPNSYRHYVERIKDHPGLFCLVPFNEPDLVPSSRAFQRFVREQIRGWAPEMPVYLLVSTMQPGTFAHDHRIAVEAFDGVIHGVFPGELPAQADAIRQGMLQWWGLHGRDATKDWIILTRAFALSAAGLPPEGSLIAQWEAARLAQLPITGFGYDGWDGHPFAIGSVAGLLQEAGLVGRRIRGTYFEARIEQSTHRVTPDAGAVSFRAVAIGGEGPLVFEWRFADGAKAWGSDVQHTFSGPGLHTVSLVCLDRQSRTAVADTSVLLVESSALAPSVAYTVSADVTFDQGGGEASIVYSGAGSDTSRRLAWHIPPEPEFTLRGTSLLELHTPGGLGRAYVPFDRARAYRIVIDVLPGKVFVHVDGALVLESSFAESAGDGAAGFELREALATFANLTVTPILFPPVANGDTNVFAESQIFYREAEDFDWSIDDLGGFPMGTQFGVHYGQGRDGKSGSDFYQVTTGEGDLSGWRNAGAVSLETGGSDTGINIRSTGPVDFWHYTFGFPTSGVARVRATLAKQEPPSSAVRLFWNGQAVGDLPVIAAGPQAYGAVQSPIFAVAAGPGKFQFRPLDLGMNFARFEVEFAPAPDTDGDGVADLLDPDDDNDGFSDADESSASQSNPLLNTSRPADLDQDFTSDRNDSDSDGDGVPDQSDPAPQVANRRPTLFPIPVQRVRATELLRLQVSAEDTDVPPQKLVFRSIQGLPTGATLDANGIFEWTPALEEIGATKTVVFEVMDHGEPPLAATNSFSILVNDPVPEGFSLVRIATTNGPLRLVVPRRNYEFGGAKRRFYLSTTGADTNPGIVERPWMTFAFAISQLEPGDVLYVREGTYPEPFTISRSGTLAQPIIISSYPGERVRIIQNAEWQAQNRDQATVYIGPGARHVWLHRLEIEGGWQPGTPYEIGYDRNGVSIAGPADGIRLINNLISRAYDAGIQTGWNGRNRSDYLIEGNVIWECGVPGYGAGIALGSCGNTGVIVRGNAIVGCGAGLNVWGYGPDNLVISDAYIYNNAIVGTGPYNVSLRSARANVFANNVFAWAEGGAGGGAVMISPDSGANVFQNEIFYGSWLHHVVLDKSSSSGPALNNLFEYSIFDPLSDISSDPLFSQWAGPQLNRLDPEFADARGYDFRTQPSSPLRQGGIAARLPGSLPVEAFGLFSATNYWIPELLRDSVTALEGKPLTFQLPLARAHPNHRVTFQAITPLPVGAQLDPASGLLVWTPDESQSPGAYRVQFTMVADESPVLTAESSIVFAVNEVNNPPSFTRGPDLVVAEDSPPQTVPNWVSSISAGPPGDAGNNVAFLLETDRPEMFSSGPAIDANGTLTFTLRADENGRAGILVKARDDGGTADGGADTSEEQAFSISVTPLNDRPIARSQVFFLEEDHVLTIPSPGADIDGDSIGFRITQSPRNGVASIADANLLYRPNGNFTGADSFRFVVADQLLESTEGTISVNVTPVSDPPVVGADRLIAGRNRLLRINAATLLANDSDPEGDAFSIKAVSSASTQGGVVSLTGSIISYMPPENHLGTDEFVYTVRDTTGLESTGIVTVSVEPGNQPPAVTLKVAGGVTIFTPPASILFEAEATDPDGVVRKVEFFHGTEKIGEDFAFPYITAWANVPLGVYEIMAQVTDDFGASAISAPVRVEVQVYEPPVDASFTAPSLSSIGEFRAVFVGSRRRQYLFQMSEDLTSWQDLRTETLDESGRLNFMHPGGGTRKYYRAFLKP